MHERGTSRKKHRKLRRGALALTLALATVSSSDLDATQPTIGAQSTRGSYEPTGPEQFVRELKVGDEVTQVEVLTPGGLDETEVHILRSRYPGESSDLCVISSPGITAGFKELSGDPSSFKHESTGILLTTFEDGEMGYGLVRFENDSKRVTSFGPVIKLPNRLQEIFPVYSAYNGNDPNLNPSILNIDIQVFVEPDGMGGGEVILLDLNGSSNNSNNNPTIEV